jgi:hypothetical protein
MMKHPGSDLRRPFTTGLNVFSALYAGMTTTI